MNRPSGVESMRREPSRDPANDAIPLGLRIGAAFAWRLLVIAAAIGGVLALAWVLSDVVVPFLIGVILAALLVPLSSFLQRHRCPKWLAIIIAWIVLLGVIAGLTSLVTERVLNEIPTLQKQIAGVGNQLKSLLATHPFGLDAAKVSRYMTELGQWLQAHASDVGLRAAAAGLRIVHMLEGIFIMIFVILFAMIDGAEIWAWVTRLFPRRARARLDFAGHAGWITLTAFARVQIFVAAIDAVGIGVGAWLLGVPLATPIAVIVFFGALVPILGSIVAGAAAVLIAFLFNGLDHALIMLGVVLLVNQLEGNVLHPFLTGGVVKVHPLGVVIGVIAGAAVGGVAGAFLAVPIIATANAMLNAAADYSSGEGVRAAPPPDEDKATP
ncbi:MAG TPA: AI-2E family transporter [Rhodanobacteraceae bacterium]|nr:AI-2E family transporter [Rhodanobacteraceae bacterium]